MTDYTGATECRQCGKVYRVELRKLRTNLPTVCPSCGFEQEVAEKQAVKAHRLLEGLEYQMARHDRAAA